MFRIPKLTNAVIGALEITSMYQEGKPSVTFILNAQHVDVTYTEAERRTLIFFGMDKDLRIDKIWQKVGLLLLYCIWEGKIRRRAISYPTIESNLFFFFDSIAENHKWVKTLAVNKNDN